ncbi:hypothetical protein G7Y89_g3939 [Cudoniella acicularis]|uniref:Uncharacterized protein n=1 Tax=Cudoniella acicularis TaxID=354080 RepID=A0A8H4RTE6_9HELO|nr:hypothetical protein G7Y89_g3939 [Cudoniella acicularis]
MGGQAFANHRPPLPTPRMPSETYNQVLKLVLTTLRQHYSLAESPIEAPGKLTYGDVDILVSGAKEKAFDPLVTDRKEVAVNLQASLGAVASITEKGNPTTNLALPWPSNKSPITDLALPWPSTTSSNNLETDTLDANDHGLYLRIVEIELLDRKKSMIFLTSSPSDVLKFLDLDEEKWWKEFGSQGEMFRFAAGCRMFWVKEESEEEGEGDVVGIIENGGQEGGEVGKKKLKHNDRQRMSKRPIFKAWIDEFIPRLRKEGQYREAKTTREQIRDEAFEKFGVRKEYETRLRDWKLVRHRDELWRDVIKGGIPEDADPAFRGAAIRFLKAVIMEGEFFDGAIPDAATVNEEGFHDLDAVRHFVASNWRRAGEIGWERQKVKAMETMTMKAAEKRKREQEGQKVAVKK